MNRVLIRPEELEAGGRIVLADHRAEHIRSVLGGQVGQTVRAGVINGQAGSARIEGVGAREVILRWGDDEAMPPAPRVDVLLALPRPKVMRRLWAPLAAMGVGRIVLVNAAKVERNYFDTHWLDPAVYEALLIEGLAQAGDTRLPQVSLERRLKPLVEDDLDQLFPAGLRLLAHPGGGGVLTDQRVQDGGRVLLAIGPEGGWSDFEVALFEGRGFLRVDMGRRTLRSDTACIALLALAHEAIRRSARAVAG